MCTTSVDEVLIVIAFDVSGFLPVEVAAIELSTVDDDALEATRVPLLEAR